MDQFEQTDINIKKLRLQGKSIEEVREYFNSIGYQRKQVEEIMAASRFTMITFFKYCRIFWPVVFLLCTYFLIISPPVAIASLPMFWSFLCTLVFLFVLLNSIVVIFYHDSKVGDLYVIPFIIFLPVFFFTYIHFGSVGDNFIKKDGQFTIGKIVDGKAVTSRRKESYTVNVAYTIDSGAKASAMVRLTESEFKNIYKGANVPMLYAKSNPSVVRLLLTRNDIAKFAGGRNKDFLVSDLISVMEANNLQATLESHEKMTEYLNSQSLHWQYNENRSYWTNTLQDKVIGFPNDKSAFLIARLVKDHDMSEELKNLNFQQIESTSGDSVFASEKYRATITVQTEATGSFEFLKITKI
ncbi:hypothetical protein TDB9533_04714 [Thalassocella blandensis]|nr:hypothetical protein TDB9533_04714 [Thalassocella blandensis]